MSAPKVHRSTQQESQKLVVKGKQSPGKLAFNTERNSFIEITYYKQNWQASFCWLRPAQTSYLDRALGRHQRKSSRLPPEPIFGHLSSWELIGKAFRLLASGDSLKILTAGLGQTTNLTALSLLMHKNALLERTWSFFFYCALSIFLRNQTMEKS